MRVEVDKAEGWLDMVYGDTFDEFGIRWQQMEQDPNVSLIVIPADIEFELPFLDELFQSTNPDPVLKQALSRFQLCYWATIDPKFNKPIGLLDVNSLNEIRLISGLGPQVEVLYVGGDYSFEQMEELKYAAGDR